MLGDRRSGRERRGSERQNVALAIEWEGSAGRRPGTLSDLSDQGCFVLCSGDVTEGEPVRLFIPLGGGMKAELAGVVRNHVYEIGFGLSFQSVSEAQANLIKDLMARYAEN